MADCGKLDRADIGTKLSLFITAESLTEGRRNKATISVLREEGKKKKTLINR